MVLQVVADIEDAQSLLPVIADQFIVVEEGEIDEPLHLVGDDLGVEHAADEERVRAGPEEELFELVGLHSEGEGFVREEVCHVLCELDHVCLLLLVAFSRPLFAILVQLRERPLLFRGRLHLVHGVEVSLEVGLYLVGARCLLVAYYCQNC